MINSRYLGPYFSKHINIHLVLFLNIMSGIIAPKPCGKRLRTSSTTKYSLRGCCSGGCNFWTTFFPLRTFLDQRINSLLEVSFAQETRHVIVA